MKLTVELIDIPPREKTAFAGWNTGTLKLKIHGHPEKEETNQAVIHFLSEFLKLPKSRIVLQRGHKSIEKHFELVDFTEQDLLKNLSK